MQVLVGFFALCTAAPDNDTQTASAGGSDKKESDGGGNETASGNEASGMMLLASQYLPPISHARGYAYNHLDYAKQYAQDDFLAHNNHYRYEHDTAYVDEKPAGAQHEILTGENPAVYGDPLAYGHFPFGPGGMSGVGGHPGYGSGYAVPNAYNVYGRNTWFSGPYGMRFPNSYRFRSGLLAPPHPAWLYGHGLAGAPFLGWDPFNRVLNELGPLMAMLNGRHGWAHHG